MKIPMTAVIALSFAASLAIPAMARDMPDAGAATPGYPAATTPYSSSGAVAQGTAREVHRQARPMRPRYASTGRMARSEVQQVQERLRSEGLYRGRIDGIIGPKTRQAVARFQARNGMRATARLDRRTMDRLMGTTSGVGSSSPNAWHGQRLFKQHPYYTR